ncbi:MAG: hypothetical protein M1168_00215 [Candidatus Marsarchaeota archaeon]|nr:hypothetical protein [Candidatus Marsarchaeota archaeon]MCL5094395.1 hypothetical protein [Candidatus Marsarchaeota archaeon]
MRFLFENQHLQNEEQALRNAIQKILEFSSKNNTNKSLQEKWLQSCPFCDKNLNLSHFPIDYEKLNFCPLCSHDFKELKELLKLEYKFVSNKKIKNEKPARNESNKKLLRKNKHPATIIYIDGVRVAIDNAIAPAIEKLNKLGAKTDFCCQGGYDSEAYISLKSGNFPDELISAWCNSGFIMSKYSVRARYSSFDPAIIKKHAAIRFQKSLKDWINHKLDVSGKRYSLPAVSDHIRK